MNKDLSFLMVDFQLSVKIKELILMMNSGLPSLCMKVQRSLKKYIMIFSKRELM